LLQCGVADNFEKKIFPFLSFLFFVSLGESEDESHRCSVMLHAPNKNSATLKIFKKIFSFPCRPREQEG